MSGLLRRSLLGLTAVVFSFLADPAAFAAPPAGSVIGNQASATYSDDSLVTRTVTSNTVVTVVQQVASLTLAASGTKTGAAGSQVAYPHTLTNTGNGTDTFALTTNSPGTGTVAFSAVQIFADANGDGVPDNSTAITSTGEVASGGVFKYVVVGTVPSSAVAGNTNALIVTAASGFTPATTATNTDNTTITANGVINATYAIDVNSGPSPSNGRTFTITYTNTGNTTVTNLTLTDLLPSGMTYVAGSGRWSVTGSGTVLTDANAADNQSGIVYDYNVTLANRITAVIASVAPGQSGTLTFQANINSGLPSGANPETASTASYSYNDGVSSVAASNTNTVQYTVAQGAAVTVSSDTVASATQGATVTFTNRVTNTGNGADTFNITLTGSTFPSGTTFQLFRSDGVTPLQDSNGDGPDTGPLAAAGFTDIVIKATLPVSASGGGPYAVTVNGTSIKDSSKTANGTDTLTSIGANTTDITNNAAGSGAPGFGPGPGPSVAVTNAVSPGGTSRFTLVVANGSTVSDTFNLQASTAADFSTGLPAGWSVVFRDAVTGAVVSNTGVVNAGTNHAFYADVTAPANATSGITVFFRALSPSSGASDIVRDAITVTTTRNLVLTPNNVGQATPGGVYVYAHIIKNTGNTTEGDGSASSVALAAVSTAGFTGVIYWDKNNNAALDASDPVITSLAGLTGGSGGASTAAGLDPGEQATLFVKVTVAPGAAIGVTDTTTLTATTTGVIGSVAAPAAVAVSDTTAVVASQVTLAKTQALDAACDGTADTAYGTAPITTGAAPGACIRYQITATNAGAANITSLVISDATPANTTYSATVAAATTAGTVSAPANAAAGTIQATVGTLTPGQSAVLSFGVRINP